MPRSRSCLATVVVQRMSTWKGKGTLQPCSGCPALHGNCLVDCSWFGVRKLDLLEERRIVCLIRRDMSLGGVSVLGSSSQEDQAGAGCTWRKGRTRLTASGGHIAGGIQRAGVTDGRTKASVETGYGRQGGC